MARIRYTKTYFQTPSRITQEVYYSLKQELSKNPNFEIAQGETFSEHFNGSLTAIKIGFGVFIILLIISTALGMDTGSAGDKFGFLAGIGFLVALVNGIYLMLEGPSYATYVKTSTDYFSRMKYAIINSSNYSEFISMFY
jgi:hypothetical protein